MVNKINWFPGHMNKTINELKKISNTIDGVIQVVDSRCVNKSSNLELLKIFKNKTIITIATKSDLADLRDKNENIFYVNLKNQNSKNLIINFIMKKFSKKISILSNKGLKNPQLNLIIVGLPNVGKSSLVNLLVSKKQVKVENKPGITKNNHWVKINNNLFLFDTPGVLFKNISNINDGYVLSLINCIKKDVLPMDDIIYFAFKFYCQKYQKELFNHYLIDHNISYNEFLEHIAKKYNLISVKNKIDFSRTLNFIFNEIINGKVCRVNYE